MEVEAKFGVPDESAFQRLLEATFLGGFDLDEVSAAELHDTYLDTAGCAIQAGGYAYRLRRQGEVYVATVKGLGGAQDGIHRRVEHELELSGPLPPLEWPAGAARDLVLQLTGGEPLHVLFTLEQTRLSRLVHKRGRPEAELCLDRVSVVRGTTVAGSFLELELELLPVGKLRDLKELAALLQDSWGLSTERRSKYERALALLGDQADAGPDRESSIPAHRVSHQQGRRANQPAEQSQSAVRGERSPSSTVSHETENPVAEQVRPRLAGEQALPAPGPHQIEEPGVTPDDPMSEAGRKALRFHYLRMLANEQGTRQGEDVEALHDMRVATRRSRAAFRVFGDYFEPEVVSPYLKGLKRTGRALGAARDLDVFRANLLAYVKALPESQRDGLQGFLAAVEGRRGEARARMIEYLDSGKYRRFVRRLGEFVETEGMGSLPVAPEGVVPLPYRVCHVAPVAIYQRLAEVRAYEEWVLAPNPPLTRLHALRIACKRLRYTLEFFREVLGAETKWLVREVVKLQDLLGALQDTVVASRLLRKYLSNDIWWERVPDSHPCEQAGPINAPGVAGYLAAQQEQQDRLLEAFPEAWDRLDRDRFRRVLAEAISAL